MKTEIVEYIQGNRPVIAFRKDDQTLWIEKNVIPDSDTSVLEDDSGYRYMRRDFTLEQDYFIFTQL